MDDWWWCPPLDDELSLFLELDTADEDDEEVDFEDLSLYVSRSFEFGVLLLAPLLCLPLSLYSFDDPPPLVEFVPLFPPPPDDDLLEPFELLPPVPMPEEDELAAVD